MKTKCLQTKYLKNPLFFTEHDWDLQHKLFHELFKESHPLKAQR